MSSSESDSESDFDISNIKSLLLKIDDILCDSIESTKKIYYAAKEPQDYFTHEFKLTHKARDVFGVKYASLKTILNKWLPEWKLSPNGFKVQLSREHAELLKVTEESIDIYSVLVTIVQHCFQGLTKS